MARATKRTSVLLGALALVFIIIIVILCIVPKGGSPPDYTQELQKSKEISDVYTDTSTASTTTTTSVPMTTTPTTTTTTTTPATTSATTPATTSATTTPTTTTPESTIVMTTPTTDDESAVFSTTDDSFFNDTTLDDSLSSDTTLSTTDDSLSNDTTVDDSLSSDTTLSTTDDSLSNDTTLDDSLSSDTTLATTDDSLSNDTTLEDSHFSDTTISTTDDSLSNDTTLDDSLSSDTTLSTTDDSLSNDTTLDDSLSSDTTLSTTDDSLSNDTTFDDYSFNDTTLSTTDDDLNDTSSESTTLSPTHQPTTTPLRTSISTEQPTTTTAETTDEEPSPTPTATTTSPSCSAQETCNTPACKTVAANMLAMMDHREGVDPCQDFYQYACGGLMQNPFLDATNHYVISKRLIKDQLETTDRDNTTTVGKMRIFYDSCLNAVDQDATKGWNQTVKKTFGEHRFAVPSKSGVAPLNLTNILAHMILHDFAPFFDMNMDVNPKDNEAFTLTLHPAVPGSPFSEDLARKVCLEDHHRRLENLGGTNSYDVEEEYKTFTNCVLSGNGLMARLDRMEEAVQRFGLLDDLGDSAMASQVLQATKSKAKSLLQDLAKMLPSVPKLKQNLANKYYDLVPVANLTHNVINWMELVQLLITVRDISNVKVLQYSKNDIEGILTVLQRYNDDDPVALSNVLLMLWSEKLYTDFVKPLGRNVGEHEYCLHAAITLMPEAASHLYMDSLSDDEINARKTQITNIVSSIKRAGKRELERSGQHQEQIQKLEYMLSNVQTINISVVDEAIETSGEQLSITSDFFDNCIQLLKNRRKLTYSMNEEMTKEVPLRFMQPYKPFGVHVYAMSSIMIPFAAQEDSGIFENIPSYLSYAGIGHMISHLVMHGYDTSGVHYQSESFDLMEGFEYYTNLKDGLEEQYQAQQSYKSPSGVTANITMSTLAVNELLADSGAARLAWEAYEMRNEPDPTHAPLSTRQYSTTANRRRRRSTLDVTRRTKREVNDPLPSLDSDEKPLPWLGLSPIKLYFLHWSQHHCSANGGMSLLELTESGEPPSRMRVNLVLQNEPLFNKAFSCTPKTKEMPFILG